eukprot:2907732-Prymnesium_polylepis.3
MAGKPALAAENAKMLAWSAGTTSAILAMNSLAVTPLTIDIFALPARVSPPTTICRREQYCSTPASLLGSICVAMSGLFPQRMPRANVATIVSNCAFDGSISSSICPSSKSSIRGIFLRILPRSSSNPMRLSDANLTAAFEATVPKPIMKLKTDRGRRIPLIVVAQI